MNHIFNTQMIFLIAAIIALLNRPAIAVVLKRSGGSNNGGMPTSAQGDPRKTQPSATIPGDNSIQKSGEGSLDLTPNNYNLLSKGKWIVYYSKPNNIDCQKFQSTWIQQTQNNKEKRIQYAKVNCEAYPGLCREEKIFPTLIEFNNGVKIPIDKNIFANGNTKAKLV